MLLHTCRSSGSSAGARSLLVLSTAVLRAVTEHKVSGLVDEPLTLVSARCSVTSCKCVSELRSRQLVM